ncbi:MAG: hypothetical protein ACI9C1_000404 [Candidatus Aldehydirespiratoraceae bacterium]|jgi:hypothetical protein
MTRGRDDQAARLYVGVEGAAHSHRSCAQGSKGWPGGRRRGAGLAGRFVEQRKRLDFVAIDRDGPIGDITIEFDRLEPHAAAAFTEMRGQPAGCRRLCSGAASVNSERGVFLYEREQRCHKMSVEPSAQKAWVPEEIRSGSEIVAIGPSLGAAASSTRHCDRSFTRSIVKVMR